MVTKRIRPLQVDGKTVHHVGIPIHWGFAGMARNGFLANTLTPSWATEYPDAGVQVVPGQRGKGVR